MKHEQLSAQTKQDIQYLLKQYVGTFSSQNKAAASLDHCSEATVISILKGW
jgi:hypothetical protein